MDKNDLSLRLARRAGLPRPAAADQVDRVVHEILEKLRQGEPAHLPGLGTFLPGEQPGFRFEGSAPASGRRKK